MRVLGFEILKASVVDDIKKSLIDLKRQYRWARPSTDMQTTLTSDLYKIPYYPMEMSHIYDMAYHSDILRTIIVSLKFQMFRKGYSFEERFIVKCINEHCGKEFDVRVDRCDICNSIAREPNATLRDQVEKRLEVVNENGQSLIDVMEMIEDDLNIMDDAYVLMTKNYYFSDITRKIIGQELEEILRVSPLVIRIVADKSGRLGYDDSGNALYICINHRDRLHKNETQCTDCKLEMLPAHYVVIYQGTSAETTSNYYYAEGEIIHVTKYSTSLLYGFSPIVTVWQKVQTLFKQDKFMLQYYGKQRPPRGMLFVNSPNQLSLVKMWQWAKEETKNNPHEIIPLGVPSTKGQLAQFIDFMNSLQEMQYIEARNELRRTIGALYGVMPLFQGDVSASGGLNNEGLQITVTNRAVERGQKIYNEKIFPKILRELGLRDYKLILNESEERDEMAEIQREIARAQYAQIMQAMGFKIKLNEQKDFEFENPDVVPEFEETEPELPELVTDDQRFSGEPTDQSKDDPLISTTPGIYNPRTDQKPKPKELFKARPAKAIKILQSNEARFKTELEKELHRIVKDIDFKRKLNEDELKRKVKDIVDKLSKRLLHKSETQLKKIYSDSVNALENEINLNIVFDKVDENAIETIRNSHVFRDSYENINRSLTGKINETISNAYKDPAKFNIAKIVEELHKVVKESESNLEKIARTETNHVSNLARENSYKKVDKSGELKYKWINPLDNRTTDICREIVERTKHGVTLHGLRGIVAGVASAHGQKARDLTPHVNCRSTFVRAF